MKQLPYYKFDVAEWINGAITLESLEAQGAFINICAYYWFKSGCLTLTEIKRRVKCRQYVFDALIQNNLIKVTGDDIKITFLDEQLTERGKVSTINRLNGSKGGAPKGNNNAKKPHIDKQETTENQPETSNIEENRTEESREEESKKEKKKEDPLRAIVYLLDGNLKVAFEDWIIYKKEKKKKLTPSTAKKQIQFLGGRDPAEAVAIINQSITAGWEGLFELKTNNGHDRTGSKKAIAGTRNNFSGKYGEAL